MTTIAHCMNLDEAQRLLAALEAEGIPAFIPDESTAAWAPHHFLTASGVRVQVADEHTAAAQRLVAAFRARQP
mgnify:CR=1 FL=1